MTISLHSTHRPSASTLWVLVLTAGSALSTFLLACATPFAAMAALAACGAYAGMAAGLFPVVATCLAGVALAARTRWLASRRTAC